MVASANLDATEDDLPYFYTSLSLSSIISFVGINFFNKVTTHENKSETIYNSIN